MSSTVLLVGSRGFIGRHVLRALEAAGHRVRRADRPEADLARDIRAEDWMPRLQGIDVAVNAAGVFRDAPGGTLQRVHVDGAAALFDACARLGVKVVQVSALGADAGAQSAFHRTKYRGDERLLASTAPSIVLQPSLVYGAGGASAALFATLAALPWIPLPGRGEQRIQPVAVEDVAAAVVRAIERQRFPRTRLAVVGPRPLTLRDFLERLRHGMGLGRARFVDVPLPIVRLAARLRIGLLDRDSLAMLERGNVADAAPLRELLGRDPVALPPPMDDAQAQSHRTAAKLGWLLPLLRLSLAIMWVAAGVVSAGLYPVQDSLALLARSGLHGAAAYAALYGASALDIMMGIASLAWPRRMLWLGQAALVVAYTAIITVFLPEQWLHPYGPVVKNLPILALLTLLYQLEKR